MENDGSTTTDRRKERRNERLDRSRVNIELEKEKIKDLKRER